MNITELNQHDEKIRAACLAAAANIQTDERQSAFLVIKNAEEFYKWVKREE